MARRRVRLCDSTLRAGEQMPGVAFGRDNRIEIARRLDAMGVPDLDIGLLASRGQLADMATLVGLGLNADLSALARLRASDIDAAAAVGLDWVILFASTSDIHAKQHGTQLDDVLRQVEEAVTHARARGLRVRFALQDATRTPLDRVRTFTRTAADAGAEVISLADTVGCATPASMAALVAAVRDEADVEVLLQCHDDFGLAVANAMAGVLAGAGAVSVTVNGIGERAGNPALAACAVALEQLHGFDTGLDLSQLVAVSRLVERASGVSTPATQPVVGRNAFRHESGIHVAAVLQDPASYEPYDPALVGAARSFALGKLSGRAALRFLAGDAGRGLDDATCRRVLDRVTELAEQGEAVGPDRIRELIGGSS